MILTLSPREAAGPIIAGFLAVSLGYGSTFDALALVTVVVSIGVVLLLQDPETAMWPAPGRDTVKLS